MDNGDVGIAGAGMRVKGWFIKGVFVAGEGVGEGHSQWCGRVDGSDMSHWMGRCSREIICQ